MVTVRDKSFRVYLNQEEIQEGVTKVASALETDYSGKRPYFLCVLNGSFMFTADLMKVFTPECEIGFIKATSYEGMESTGKVTFSGAENVNIEDRDVIIIEDIVDTGNTLQAIYKYLAQFSPKSLKICTLLFKQEAYQHNLPIDYVCFNTENKFLLGYGLDYDGLGRNLPEVYILNE